MKDYTRSLLIVAIATVGFMISDSAFRHWFVIPVTICGGVCLAWCLDWLTGSQDTFQPIAIFSAFAVFFFYIAPMLHVGSDYWMRYIVPVDDWRPSLGFMATLNVVNIVVLYVVFSIRRRFIQHHTRRSSSLWRIAVGRSRLVFAAALTVAVMLEAYSYTRLGGVGGVADAYKSSLTTGEDAHAGMGMVYAISENFPVLLAFFILSRPRFRPWLRFPLVVGALLGMVFVLQLVFGGLRGSRGNTIWAVLITVCAVHKVVYRFRLWQVVAMGCAGVAFMWGASFYKELGAESLTLVQSGITSDELTAMTGRDINTVLLGDFERSDVQAHALIRLGAERDGYELAHGMTYLGAMALLVPKAFRPDNAVGKIRWTTWLEYGSDSYPRLRCSRIYGLAGEALLNFPFYLVPFAFGLLGALIRLVNGMYSRIGPDDSRSLLAGVLVLLPIFGLAFDSDNILWFIVKHAGCPTVIVLCSSMRSHRNPWVAAPFGTSWALSGQGRSTANRSVA